MDRKSSSFWLFLLLGVGVGLCFEMIKTPDLNARNAHFAFMRMEDEADEPAPASSTFRGQKKIKIIPGARASEPAPRLAGLDHGTANGDATATTTPEDGSGDKVKKADKADDKSKDKKDKDKDKKKKKKKKKTVPGTGEDPNKDASNKDESKDTEADEAKADADAPMGPGPSYATGFGADDESRIPQTLEEWETYILGKADFNRVSRFIRFYQTGVVKADVFYAVVEKMLAANDDKLNEFGVMALGSTPSPLSFSDMVKVTHAEAMSAKVKKQAQGYLNGYMNIQYVRVLSNVLSLDLEDDDQRYVRLEAIRLLQIAADYYLKGSFHASTGGTNGQPNQQSTTPSAAVKNYFSSLTGALTRVAQAESDGSVRSAAGQALTNLEALLGKS